MTWEIISRAIHSVAIKASINRIVTDTSWKIGQDYLTVTGIMTCN